MIAGSEIGENFWYTVIYVVMVSDSYKKREGIWPQFTHSIKMVMSVVNIE